MSAILLVTDDHGVCSTSHFNHVYAVEDGFCLIDPALYAHENPPMSDADARTDAQGILQVTRLIPFGQSVIPQPIFRAANAADVQRYKELLVYKMQQAQQDSSSVQETPPPPAPPAPTPPAAPLVDPAAAAAELTAAAEVDAAVAAEAEAAAAPSGKKGS